jgi:hypothetical protein
LLTLFLSISITFNQPIIIKLKIMRSDLGKPLTRREMKNIHGGTDQFCARMGQNPLDYPFGCCEGKTCNDGFGTWPKCVPNKQPCHVDPT